MSSQSQQQLLEKIGVILSDLNVQYRTIEQQVTEDPKMSASLLYLNAKNLTSHLRLYMQCQDVFNSAQQPTVGASLIQSHEDTDYLFLNKIKEEDDNKNHQAVNRGDMDSTGEKEADADRLEPFVKTDAIDSENNGIVEYDGADGEQHLDKQGDGSLPPVTPEGSNTQNSEILAGEFEVVDNKSEESTAVEQGENGGAPVYYADLQNALNASEPFPLSEDPKVHLTEGNTDAGDDGVNYEDNQPEEGQPNVNNDGEANHVEAQTPQASAETVVINPGARGTALQMEEQAGLNSTNHASFLQRAEEKLDAEKKSLNDSFARPQDVQPDLTPIADLKSGISLNDKLLFIRDLFSGYNLSYAEAIDNINKMDNFDIARNFLEKSYAQKNNWQAKPGTVDRFYNLISRRYL